MYAMPKKATSKTLSLGIDANVERQGDLQETSDAQTISVWTLHVPSSESPVETSLGIGVGKSVFRYLEDVNL